MYDADLEKYCKRALDGGVNDALQINPSSVVTAAWVRWKCQFGCTEYGKAYCCPPHTNTPEQTRALLDCYNRAILFHAEMPRTPPEKVKKWKPYLDMLIDLEIEMFKDGYYKAFVLLAGPCRLCTQCAKMSGAPCNFGLRSRPAMESCGIDVYQTARNNGFFIKPLRDKNETQNIYCLMLVD